MSNVKEIIESGKAYLGIEFGSTRIKAVLIDEEHNPIASGSHTWENRYENGLWTYSLDDIWNGARSFPSLSNAIYPCIMALNPIAPSFLIVTPYSFCTFSAISR